MLALPISIHLGFSMENSIYESQYEPHNLTKDSSGIYEKCKQSNVIGDTTQDVTTQINSEVNNASMTEKSSQYIDESQYEPHDLTKNSSGIYEKCKQSDMISDTTQDVTPQINSEVNNASATEKSSQYIDESQYESHNLTKDSSGIYEKCKQSNVIGDIAQDATTQINSEKNNSIGQKNQITINDEKQNENEIQKNSVKNKTEKENIVVQAFIKEVAAIYKSAYLEEIIKNLKDRNIKINENTLVVLDIDGTILMSMEVTAASKYKDRWERLEEQFKRKYPQYGICYNYYVDVFLKSQKEKLTELIWKSFINDLKSRGAKVLVVTAMENRYLLDCNSKHTETITETMWIKLRYKQLNDALDPKEPTIKNVFKNDLPRWLREEFDSPYYYEGILASQPWSKSQAIYDQLQYWYSVEKWKPANIVLIDDQIGNHWDIGALSSHLGVPFTGYIYTGADRRAYDFDFCEKRALCQLKYMVETGKWLSDEEAAKMLQTREQEIEKELQDLQKNYGQKSKGNKKNKKSKKPNTAESKSE